MIIVAIMWERSTVPRICMIKVKYTAYLRL